MSDLYDASLDHLLKGEAVMSDYLDYLKESTDTVKSRRRLSLLLLLSYLGVWALAPITFWFAAGPTDAMGFSILLLWVLLPVATFTVSLLLGKYDYGGRLKWRLPVPRSACCIC